MGMSITERIKMFTITLYRKILRHEYCCCDNIFKNCKKCRGE